MNQAQHIWLAIMTELAIERAKHFSHALTNQYIKHTKAAGVWATIILPGGKRLWDIKLS